MDINLFSNEKISFFIVILPIAITVSNAVAFDFANNNSVYITCTQFSLKNQD